jgi:pyrroline-5-carboxylate reductase
MERTTTPLAIIGGGNIAQALVRGGIDAGLLTPALVAVAEPEPAKRELFRSWGARPLKGPEELPGWLTSVEHPGRLAQVLLAVKPQMFGEVSLPLARSLGSDPRVIITIMAGVTTAKVSDALRGAPVIRAMPNMAATVRRSTTALCIGGGGDPEEIDDTLAVQLFESIGRVVRIEEPLMDAFTAVVGSGPAYVFYLTEAMARAAEQLGFDRDTGEWIARWTVSGAGALLDATDQPPETLRAAVTSKGGTTAAATAVLDEAKVMDAFVRAIAAARDRGRELSKG